MADDPPITFRWRRIQHRVTWAEGPERVAPEWWRPTSPDANESLEDHPLALEPARRRSRLDHRELPRHLIREDRYVDGVGNLAQHVEIGHGRLDHHGVGAFGEVEHDLVQRLARVGRVQLVGAPVPEGGC